MPSVSVWMSFVTLITLLFGRLDRRVVREDAAFELLDHRELVGVAILVDGDRSGDGVEVFGGGDGGGEVFAREAGARVIASKSRFAAS